MVWKAGFRLLTFAGTSGIDDGITSRTIAPRLKFLVIVTPFYPVIIRFECPAFHMGKMPEYHLVKVPPYQFVQKHAIQLARFPGQLADTDRTKTQMHTKSRCSRNGGKVPLCFITTDNFGRPFFRREGFTAGSEIEGPERWYGKFRLSVKMDNLTNKKYWVGYTTVNPQKLRNFAASVAFKF